MDYYAVDREIAQIERKIRILSALKPTNLLKERMKFFVDPIYNPQFKYRRLRFSPDALLERLDALKTDRTPLGMIFLEKINELKLKIMLLKTIGTCDFIKISQKIYGETDDFMLQRAYQKLKFPFLRRRDRRHHRFSAEEAKKIFERMFEEYGLRHWEVAMKDDLLTDCVAGKRNTLFIKSNASFSRQRISRLIAHEIETHLFTAENGKLQPYKIFNRGLAHYLQTQEGLAVYAQELKQDIHPAIQSWSALSVIATHYAELGSFSSVCENLAKLRVPQTRAFKIAARVKRGLTDTGQPGAFTKDIIYFTGAYRIHKFVEKKGDLRKLYIGKVALEDMPFIQQIPNLAPPKYLPRWVKERYGLQL